MLDSAQVMNTPLLRICLSHHADKFDENSHALVFDKQVNFVYGKNGTGKTTIADEIFKQLSSDYDVCIFKDFEGVIENNRLNAVALGSENATIQKQIDFIENEILRIKEQVEQPENKEKENLYTKAARKKEEFDKHEKKLNQFYIDSAREIKNQNNPQVAKTSYDKVSFKNDIEKAILLTEEDVRNFRAIIRTEKKDSPRLISFPKLDLYTFFASANEILLSSISQTCDIPELTDNIEKQNFARQGLKVHERKNGEICAFCGNEITAERWQVLGSYFNNEVKNLENRIDAEVIRLQQAIKETNDNTRIKEVDFYDRFKVAIDNLNFWINAKYSEYREFLKNIQSEIEKKRNNLFSESHPLENEIPDNFDDIETMYKDLVNRNNELTQNLTSEQDKARDALRYHEVKLLLDSNHYEKQIRDLEKLRLLKNENQNNLSEMQEKLQDRIDERADLIQKTQDVEKIAKKVNKLLSSMGVVSFSLKLVEDDNEKQKGQYQIQSHDKTIRPIVNLSKGEKNIIAFLYFVLRLESNEKQRKPKIIVLDDPMTSNDDTMQYLMISEIQRLYRELNSEDFLVLLTHNCHFYLNVRLNTNAKYKVKGKEEHVSFYKKYGVFHLFSDGKRSTIKKITNGKWDFKTNYETLWRELVFLYNSNEATSALMLNPCRKICETYCNFTKKDGNVFYKNNLSAKKLFDVNQHSIDDFEAEANGKTKNEIKTILKNLFVENGAEEHFFAHWIEESGS